MPYTGTGSNTNFELQGQTPSVRGRNVVRQEIDRGDRTISPSDFDPILNDMAENGLNRSLLKDGTVPLTGNLNANGNKVIGLPSGSLTALNPGDAVNALQVRSNIIPFIDSVTQEAASPNAIVLNFSPIATDSTTVGETYRFRARQTITGPATLIGGTGRAAAGLFGRGTALSRGNIVSGEIYTVLWDNGRWNVLDYSFIVTLTTAQFNAAQKHIESVYYISDAN